MYFHRPQIRPLPITTEPPGARQSQHVPSGPDFNSYSFELFGLDPFDLFDDGCTPFENDFSSYFLSQDLGLENGLQTSQVRSGLELHKSTTSLVNAQGGPSHELSHEHPSISRLGSPLPLVREGHSSIYAQRSSKLHRAQRFTPCWKVSQDDHDAIQNSLVYFSAILPEGFAIPSRHTVSRYLEGCVKGLLEHMPMVHLATFTPTSAAPELLIAMMAIGAQFRFEIDIGLKLFYAAKALIMHRVQSGNDDGTSRPLSQPADLPAGWTPDTPISTRNFPSRDNGTEAYQSSTHFNTNDAGVQTMQAILSLMVMGSWGPRQLVSDALCLQSLLAILVREDGMHSDNDVAVAAEASLEHAWRAWIHTESRRRVKNMAFTFMNLQSVAYHISPSISQLRV